MARHRLSTVNNKVHHVKKKMSRVWLYGE